MTHMLRNRGLVALLAGASLSLALASVSTPAQAAASAIGPGRVQLCSKGNYSSFLTLSPSNGIGTITTVVPAGSCQTFDLIPSSDNTVGVHGIFNTSDNTFTIGSSFTVPSSGGGWKVFTEGSTANGGAGAWWVFG